MNRTLKVTLFATLVLAVGIASGQLTSIAQEDKTPKTEAAATLEVSKLDSSSTWKAKIAGGCTKELCCAERLEGHLKAVKNIEKFEMDKKNSMVTLTIQKDKEVNVKELQKALSSHFTIKTIEKSEEKSEGKG